MGQRRQRDPGRTAFGPRTSGKFGWGGYLHGPSRSQRCEVEGAMASVGEAGSTHGGELAMNGRSKGRPPAGFIEPGKSAPRRSINVQCLLHFILATIRVQSPRTKEAASSRSMGNPFKQLLATPSLPTPSPYSTYRFAQSAKRVAALTRSSLKNSVRGWQDFPHASIKRCNTQTLLCCIGCCSLKMPAVRVGERGFV